MRRYRPRWVDAYKWDYAVGLITHYDELVNELYELEAARLGYAKPINGMPRGGAVSDPTYVQAAKSESPTDREVALAQRTKAVEQAWNALDEYEQGAMKMHFFDHFTYEQLIAYGYPFSKRTLARIKSRLIWSIVRDLCL